MYISNSNFVDFCICVCATHGTKMKSKSGFLFGCDFVECDFFVDSNLVSVFSLLLFVGVVKMF